MKKANIGLKIFCITLLLVAYAGGTTLFSKYMHIPKLNFNFMQSNNNDHVQEEPISTPIQGSEQDFVAKSKFDPKIQYALENIFTEDEYQSDLHTISALRYENGIMIFEFNNGTNPISIDFNNTSYDVTSLDLIGLENCVNLSMIYLNNLDKLTLATSNNTVKGLSIYNSVLDDNLKGIENYYVLDYLACNKTSLSDLTYVVKNRTLDGLYAPNNQISNIDLLSTSNRYRFINLYNNPIYDFTPLQNHRAINLWNDGYDSIYNLDLMGTEWQPTTKCIYINVDNLKIRSTPNTFSESNVIGIAPSKKFYSILGIVDETSSNGYKWIKIGNDAWVASNEGDWTYIYE